MYIKANDSSIRYTGRWDISEEAAVTTAPGGMIEIAYCGKEAVLHFDIKMNMCPAPHIWITLDDGGKTESAVDRVLRIEAAEKGKHIIKIIYKSAVEIQHRWYPPLIGKISFLGAEADEPAQLPADERKVIEFIGDSITEGVLIDAQYGYTDDINEFNQQNRPIQDDSTATYAYLTAMKLNMRPVIMGYGGVGVTKGGCGSVPRAWEAYPYNFAGSPAVSSNPELIVINHGANDMRASAEEYILNYEKLLETVRRINPRSKIAVLSAFYGVYPAELKELVEDFNRKNNDSVYFIDSAGWLPREPLHPLRDGHITASEYLTEELKKIL